MILPDDTIVAIATPIGEGGISVIRISGKESIIIADRGFKGKVSPNKARTHTLHFGKFVDENNELIDEVVIGIFKAPNSYTGENVIEISCHGGIYIVQRILETILKLGARQADPGEFTKRAFLNGRIDLSQAEAIAELIKSRSEASRRASMNQLQGKLSEKIAEIREKLIDLCGLIELELDFGSEDNHVVERSKIIKSVNAIIEDIKSLNSSYLSGRVYREGIKVVITGRPNVGKSSIFNNILKNERAIVTAIAGTTRDTIEGDILINGVLFRIIDTAGFRKTENLIEIHGQLRTQKEIEGADIILLAMNATDGLVEEDKVLLDKIISDKVSCKNIIMVWNKIDLTDKQYLLELPALKYPSLFVSALTGEGIDKIKEEIKNLLLNQTISSTDNSVVVTNIRHVQCLTQASLNLNNAINGIRLRNGNELIALDIRSAINSLAEITGYLTTDDVLENIFSKFCVGK